MLSRPLAATADHAGVLRSPSMPGLFLPCNARPLRAYKRTAIRKFAFGALASGRQSAPTGLPERSWEYCVIACNSFYVIRNKISQL